MDILRLAAALGIGGWLTCAPAGGETVVRTLADSQGTTIEIRVTGSPERVITGSGDRITATRPLPAFTGVDLVLNAHTTIRRGAVSSIEVSADDNVVPLIRSEVVDGRLTVTASSSFRTADPPRLAVTARPELESVRVTGSGEADLQAVDAEALALEITGSGAIRAQGTARRLHARVVGSGRLDAAGLATERCEVEVNGAGSAEVHASAWVRAQVLGSGHVALYGRPEAVSSEVVGSGAVTRHR